MKITKILAIAAVGMLPMAASAATQTFNVDAAANSTTGGVGLNTGFTLNVGDSFSVSADPSDTWVLGATAQRVGNADGLPAFVDHSQDGLTARFGTLVGRIGGGNFFSIGTKFVGTATEAGNLELYAFDSYNGDNSGEIAATVSVPAIPVPASGALLLAALGAVALRRRLR